MKIIEINAVPYGSTGMIAKEITKICSKTDECYFCYSWTKKRKGNINENEILIGSFLGKCFHMALSQITGFELNFSFIDTLLFIRKLKRIKPEIIHLHILHSWYINVPLFFKYVKKNNIKVIWTFHDCWAFTGHCPYFELVECSKWKTKCFNCPIHKEYPKSVFDNSKKMYLFKRKWFTYLDSDKLVIVTPSKWLANHAEQSFMNKYKIITINNGIDLNIFKPIDSDFRKKYDCEDKKIILGVALDWGKRKGLDIFVKLSKDLSNNYKIVLVGTNDKIDLLIPKNIISIHRTENQIELAKIYSAADLFVNPTREDNFPTVNIEALACGLPVLTFNTGGSPEIIDSKSGKIIEKNNYEILKDSIIELCNKKLRKEDCLERAKLFLANDRFLQYVELFKGEKEVKK